MKKEVLKEPIFAEKILRIIRSSPSMEEMRDLAARSFRMNSFEPRKSYDWDGDYSKGIQMGLYAE